MGTQHTEEQMLEGQEEACSEAALRRITGEEDLSDVRNLVLTVDTNETQVILRAVGERLKISVSRLHRPINGSSGLRAHLIQLDFVIKVALENFQTFPH